MPEKAKLQEGLRWVLALIVVVVAALAIRAFVVRTVRVKGVSMEPNFYHNEVVVVNQLSRYISDPKPGQIIICSYDNAHNQEYIIKRVIGLPGDVIDIAWNGDNYDVYVNDEHLKENYIKEPMVQPGDQEYPFTVPEGQFFVMGDNRNASADSRDTSIGLIRKENIMGQVVLRIFPFNKISIIGDK